MTNVLNLRPRLHIAHSRNSSNDEASSLPPPCLQPSKTTTVYHLLVNIIHMNIPSVFLKHWNLLSACIAVAIVILQC